MRDEQTSRALTGALLTIAIVVAFYVGFRLPNTWSATLDAVSVTDGFHRRFVVGTLLRPLAIATDYNYWLFVGFSYAVLAALIAILVRLAMRAQLLSRRLLIVAFFMLPTGPFLFHEVGYLEQVLYLVLFGCIYLAHRQKWVAATCVMALAPFVHEIAILTVLPIYGLVALRTTSFKRAMIVTAIPTLVGLFVFLIPAASDEAVATLAAQLSRANFKYRHDALELFGRSFEDNWRLYRLHEVVIHVKPVAFFVIGAFACLFWIDRGFAASKRWLVFVVSCAAIGLPGLLVLGGWDHNRWVFLLLTNFFVVLWMSLNGRGHELRRGTIAVLVTALLVISHINIFYFLPDSPRELGYRAVRNFLKQMIDGRLFEKPTY